jgi:hypothetical protein
MEDLSMCLRLYSPLLSLGRFYFSDSRSFTQSVGLLERGNSLSQGRYLYTEQDKHRINAHRHPCLEWDSNTRSQSSRERRQFMPQTARPPCTDLFAHHFILISTEDSHLFLCEAPNCSLSVITWFIVRAACPDVIVMLIEAYLQPVP